MFYLKCTALILLIVLGTGCTTTVVFVTKNVSVYGDGNTPLITGSDLKDNEASTENTPKLKIPYKLVP